MHKIQAFKYTVSLKHPDITFHVCTPAAHADAVGAVEAARVQELERVDKKGAKTVSAGVCDAGVD